MFKKAVYFIKYNNAVVLILAAVFMLGTGVLAQTDQGQEIIGGKQTSIEGIDNTLLISADLDKFDMEFKISEQEKIQEDEKYYYITYTYMDLVMISNAWQYQVSEKTRKVSKKLKDDLGVYLAEELAEEYYARVKELKQEQKKAEQQGLTERFEVTEYSGLIGRTLSLAGKVFEDYEPVKKVILPAPVNLPANNLSDEATNSTTFVSDNLTAIAIEADEKFFGELSNIDDTTISTSTDTTVSTSTDTTTQENICDIDNLALCDSESDCVSASGFWYDGVCNAEEAEVIVIDCGMDHLDLCYNQSDCETATGYWDSELGCIEKSCDNTYGLCSSEDECVVNWYWYNSVCNSTASTTVESME